MRSRQAASAGLALAMTVPALADTPQTCIRFQSLPMLALDALPANDRDMAQDIRRQAARIAKGRGVEREPILSRLKSNNPKSSYLLAYVPSGEGRIAVLVVHSLLQGDTHSLVDLPDAFVFGMNEPEWLGAKTRTGFSYIFYGADKHFVHIVDTETSLEKKSRPRTMQQFHQWTDTGYSNSGAYQRCVGS
jgi:hypothetical protein